MGSVYFHFARQHDHFSLWQGFSDPIGTGIQFFHFNGAKPVTEFTGIIGFSGYITAMQWDKSNHLYAINGASGNVHVYTATSTSVVEAPGSPYPIGAEGILVAP